MSPTPSALLSALSSRGTCSAADLARELGCGVGPVLALISNPEGLKGCGLRVQKIAGPKTGSGFLYRLASWNMKPIG